MDILVPAWIDGQLQPVEKRQTHLRRSRHKAVPVFVMRDAETLLQRRDLSKYHTPSLWANACCAQRRLEKKFGRAGQVPVYRDTVEYHADVGGGMIEHEVAEIYTPQVEQINIHPNPEEVMDYRWQNLKNLNNAIAEESEIFTPWLKVFLSQHSKAIFGA